MDHPASLPAAAQPAMDPALHVADDGDALWTEWGYEAADPALQARLWGETCAAFEDRR